MGWGRVHRKVWLGVGMNPTLRHRGASHIGETPRGSPLHPYDRVMAIVLILLAIVVVLVVVIAWLAIGGQRSRAKPGDEAWQEKVREEYEPRDWDEDD